MVWNLLVEINQRLIALEKAANIEDKDSTRDDRDRYNGYSDDTEYLLSSRANREHLLRAMKNVKEGTNLVSVPIEQFLK
jgi:hypothetical protein